MNVSGIIQARTGSTRLPKKIFYKINNKTLLELYIDRVKHSKLLNNIIVATTTNPNDDIVIDLIKEKYGDEIKLFRGSENDVLDRYYRCAQKFKVDIICRLTPDDPFVEPDIIDMAINKITSDDYDFVTNHFPEVTFIEGLDMEVYTFKALEKCWKKSKLKSEREHVFLYIKNNAEKFKIYNFKQEKNESHIRLTIDYNKDYILTSKIYQYWNNDKIIPRYKDIIEILDKHPELLNINKGIPKYEGINKSIARDEYDNSL